MHTAEEANVLKFSWPCSDESTVIAVRNNFQVTANLHKMRGWVMKEATIQDSIGDGSLLDMADNMTDEDNAYKDSENGGENEDNDTDEELNCSDGASNI